MKKHLSTILLALLLVGCTTSSGCAGTFDGTGNPTGVEDFVYNIETNYTLHIITDPVTGISVTNVVPVYSYTVDPRVAQGVDTATSIVDMLYPGAGGLAGGIVIGLATLWGRLRSWKRKVIRTENAGGVLTENIEAIRTFVRESVPEGNQYDQALARYLARAQEEKQVRDDVRLLRSKSVFYSRTDAGAEAIRRNLEQTKKTS